MIFGFSTLEKLGQSHRLFGLPSPAFIQRKHGFLHQKKGPKKLPSPFEPYILLYYSNGDGRSTRCFALRRNAARTSSHGSYSRILRGSGVVRVFLGQRGSRLPQSTGMQSKLIPHTPLPVVDRKLLLKPIITLK